MECTQKLRRYENVQVVLFAKFFFKDILLLYYQTSVLKTTANAKL